MEHSYRFAVREDVPLILAMIRELADYEGLLPEVVATEAVLGEWLFDRRGAEVLFALAPDGAGVGFALFFLCPPGAPGPRVRQGPHPAAGPHRKGAGLRPAGVVVPRLQYPQHRLLPLPRRRADARLDRLPPHRGDAGPPGGLNLTASPAAGGAA